MALLAAVPIHDPVAQIAPPAPQSLRFSAELMSRLGQVASRANRPTEDVIGEQT
jgi:hypothetical protein